MKNLITKQYRGYIYYVEPTTFDFYVQLKSRKNHYAPFGSWDKPEEVIDNIIKHPDLEDKYATINRRTMERNAVKDAETHQS